MGNLFRITTFIRQSIKIQPKALIFFITFFFLFYPYNILRYFISLLLTIIIIVFINLLSNNRLIFIIIFFDFILSLIFISLFVLTFRLVIFYYCLLWCLNLIFILRLNINLLQINYIPKNFILIVSIFNAREHNKILKNYTI